MFISPTLVSCTLSSGQSLSAVAAIPDGMRPIALLLPSNWTASLISLQASFDNSTFYEVTDSSNNASATYQPSQMVAMAPLQSGWSGQIYGAQFLKIRSGSSGSPSAQGGDRALQIVCYNYREWRLLLS